MVRGGKAIVNRLRAPEQNSLDLSPAICYTEVTGSAVVCWATCEDNQDRQGTRERVYRRSGGFPTKEALLGPVIGGC